MLKRRLLLCWARKRVFAPDGSLVEISCKGGIAVRAYVGEHHLG